MRLSLVFCLFFQYYSCSIDSSNVSPCHDLNDQKCNETSTSFLDFQFKTEIVRNEYIVTFTGYYKSVSRAGFISAALNHSGVSSQYFYFFSNFTFLLGVSDSITVKRTCDYFGGRKILR